MTMDQDRIERVTQWLRLTARPEHEIQEALKQHMLDYIQWYWRNEYRGVTLSDLNRRFGKNAKALETSARKIVEGFFHRRLTDIIEHRKSTVVISMEYDEFITKACTETEENLHWEEAAARARKLKNNFLNASVGYVPPEK